jgi:hypothetical protein
MGYLFDPERLRDIARKAIGLSHAEMVQVLCDELRRAYPGHISGDEGWIFSITAGATGVMKILHASLSEYVLIFGTPVGTEGFSGRYRMDIHDFQLAGEMWTYTEDRVGERVVTRAGDSTLLPRGRAKAFRLLEDGWMLEYGRGLVPMALPLALGDSVFSCMDATTIARTLWVYGKLTTRELLKGKI